MSGVHILPDGSEVIGKDEKVLWEGRPQTAGLARRLFHIRVILGYFAVVAVWSLASAYSEGFRANAALVQMAWIFLPAAAAAAIIYAMAWVIAFTTRYTITDRRVIMEIGVAVPIALTLPLKSIVSADVRIDADGSGDIPVKTGQQKLAYLLVWPHTRPWQFKSAEPMLRAIPDVQNVAEILSQALLAATPTGEVIAITSAARPSSHSGEPATAAA